MHQHIRQLPVRRLDDPAERRTGDTHLFGRLLLVESIEVRQPDGLEFVETHDDFFEIQQGDADRFENRRSGLSGDPAAAERSWHGKAPPVELWVYAQNCQAARL